METRWKVPSAVLPFFMCLGFLLFIDVFLMDSYSIAPNKLHMPEPFHKKPQDFGFSIKTSGCRIPYLDPFDQTVLEFIKTPDEVLCNKGVAAMFNSNETHLILNKTSLSFYGVEDFSELNCCYFEVARKPPLDQKADKRIEVNTTCHRMQESTLVLEEFISVACTLNASTVYQDAFSFVPVKVKRPRQEPSYNVLVIGLDAVSRINLHRQMPETLKYLKQLGLIELLGYNKIGDNTFPNLMPVLTGLLEGELKNSCWPHENDYFDNCTFLWNKFKDKNFVTAFGEDSSWMGIFNYQRRGFLREPTDYDYSYFNRFAEEQIGNSHEMNVDQCIGARLVYEELLNYITKFVRRMSLEKLNYFGFFWGASLSHDYLNKPNLGDVFYKNFFRNLFQDKLLQNTVLVFMSDHGIRWGGIRQTFQGKMEERLPFLTFLLPQSFKVRFPSAVRNLERNVKRLTSPLDLHETLLALINPQSTLLNVKTNITRRAYSLFNEIPEKRTCEDAGITQHWCTCQTSKEIAVNDSLVVKASNYATNYMNNLLEPYPQCANLTLKTILNARLMSHEDHINNGNSNFLDYMLTIETQPGQAVFELTIRHDTLEPKNEKFQLAGTISRLNLYGKQSDCITEYHMKLYCYCTSFF